MSDIDFDELDKAVNTLMSDVPKTTPVKTDDIKTLTINSTLSDTATPSLAKLDSTLAAVNGVTTISTTQPLAANQISRPSSASLASRRTGRFMDVVHPSADMKTVTKTLSRQGVSVEPATPISSKKPVDDSGYQNVIEMSVPASSISTSAQSVPSTIVSTARDSSENDWPDPLEMSGYESEPAVRVEQPVETESIETSVVSEAPVETIAMPAYEDPQPLTSPFITDAKVEKRPLGGGPVEEPGRAPVLGVLAKEDEDINVADPSDQLPAMPPEIEAELPPELQSDLMAIEAAGEMPAPTASPAQKTAPAVDNAVQKTPQVAQAQPLDAAPVNSGPTSIPQQYHEAPSTSDEPNGSIYDTASYHQPLAHPAKSKSGWLWIVWILLLLIVGGGGAAALYFTGVI